MCIKHFNYQNVYTILATDMRLIIDRLPNPGACSFVCYKKKLRNILCSNKRHSKRTRSFLWDVYNDCQKIYCKPGCELCQFNYHSSQVEIAAERQLEYDGILLEYFSKVFNPRVQPILQKGRKEGGSGETDSRVAYKTFDCN